jgi:hypothetical protein
MDSMMGYSGGGVWAMGAMGAIGLGLLLLLILCIAALFKYLLR